MKVCQTHMLHWEFSGETNLTGKFGVTEIEMLSKNIWDFVKYC